MLHLSSTLASLMASTASRRRTRSYFDSCARRARTTKSSSLRHSNRDSRSRSTGSLKTITRHARARSQSMWRRRRPARTMVRPNWWHGKLPMVPLLCDRFFVTTDLSKRGCTLFCSDLISIRSGLHGPWRRFDSVDTVDSLRCESTWCRKHCSKFFHHFTFKVQRCTQMPVLYLVAHVMDKLCFT